MIRCPWVPSGDALYQEYHDKEWGVPVHDDRNLFEYLILEGFQAGLSWRTVLYKRDHFREAFAGFDPLKVAEFDQAKIAELLNNPGIIRNKLKVNAAVSNARAFLDIQQKYGSFDSYIWRFVDGRPVHNTLKTLADYPANTGLSDTISKDLKQNGFKFVGTTVCYAHMQATGMVNDHTVNCFRYKELLT